MHIFAHRVFDQLPLEGLCVVNLHDAGGDRKEIGQLGRTVAPRSCNQLEAIGVRSYRDGLNKAMLPNAFGILFR